MTALELLSGIGVPAEVVVGRRVLEAILATQDTRAGPDQSSQTSPDSRRRHRCGRRSMPVPRPGSARRGLSCRCRCARPRPGPRAAPLVRRYEGGACGRAGLGARLAMARRPVRPRLESSSCSASWPNPGWAATRGCRWWMRFVNATTAEAPHRASAGRGSERHGSPGASSTDWQAGTADSTQRRPRRRGDQNSQYATPPRVAAASYAAPMSEATGRRRTPGLSLVTWATLGCTR
jgi:hypothetical protein